MPRERIQDTNNPTFEIIVGWGKDTGYVQVATEVSDWLGRMETFYNPAGTVPDRSTPLVFTNTGFSYTTTTAVTAAATSTPPITTITFPPAGMKPAPTLGWYVNLDRHQINDLIRILRRARDQAFGRDE